MTYTINNKEFTQPKLSLFSIPALLAAGRAAEILS